MPTDPTTYKVIFTGIRSDLPSSDSRVKLAALFKTTPEQIDKLIEASTYVLKKSLTGEMAAKYQAAIEAAGGTCRVESEEQLKDPVAPPVTAPVTTPPVTPGSIVRAQPVRPVTANEVLIYLPIEIALAHASAAMEQIGTITQLDKSQYCIDGFIRSGLQSVGIRMALAEKSESETTLLIGYPSGDDSSAGAKSAAKRLIDALVNLDKPGYKPDRLGMHRGVLVGAPLLAIVALAAAAYFVAPEWFQPSVTMPQNAPQIASAGPKALYRFWQSKYVREPGAYEDEMVGGEVLYECKIGGVYPAYFGYLIIRQTLMIQPNPDAKPFAVYIAGIDYGDRLRLMTQAPETGGKGAIDFLRTQGCEIKPGLEAQAASAISRGVP